MSRTEQKQFRGESALEEPDLVVTQSVSIFEPELDSQQTELVYTQAPAAIVTAYLLAVIVTLGTWSVADHTHLLVWLTAQSILSVARLGLVYSYRRAGEAQRSGSRWGLLFFSGALVSGVVWGCLGLMFSFSWPVEYQTLTLMALTGVIAGAISSYAAMLSVYIAFMVPAMLIPAQSMLMHNSNISNNMGLLIMLFAAALLVIARNYNKSVIKSLRLREENNALLRETADMNAALQTEAHNRHRLQDQLLRERQLFTKGPVTVFRCRAEHGWPIEYISETISHYGYNSDELITGNLMFASIVHASDVQRIIDSELQSGEDGARYIGIDYRVMCANGDVRWVYSYSIPVRNHAGELTHYAGYILDITSRKQAEYELDQARERAQITLHSIADAVITTDVNGQVEYLNPRAEQLTGWDREIARGLTLSRILCKFDEKSQSLLEEPVMQSLHVGKTIQSGADECLLRHDGTELSVQFSASPIMSDDGTGMGVILVIHDVTEARLMEEKISYQSSHDALTGLINRAEFEKRLNYAIESAWYEDEKHVLCYVDLDNLKIVNDTCSHESGDELLRDAARLIQGCLRESDLLARLGGDEFGVLLKNCSLSGAVELVEKILGVIRGIRFQRCERVFEITASIGVTAIDADTLSVPDIMIEADLACHAAKDSGCDHLHIYHPEDQGLARRHSEMQWVSKLTEAIKSDKLVLYSQEIVPVVPDSVAGRHFEVLVRMLDTDGSIVPPDRFLPAAERYNLINSLDRWVVTHSFAWYAQEQGRRPATDLSMISINLSGVSVTDRGFLKYIKDEMKRHNIPPGMICFEITETAAIANLDAATEFIHELKRQGCRFALDDFGSGLSSFSYLKNLPVDYLKIDGSFVRGIETDEIDHAMVGSIHQLATLMGIKTIAEFVENDGILQALANIGVDYAQGYGIAKPRPLQGKGASSVQSA
jgi:diguanylate cyclase (GGDEF)-like protein/PAS domain S-box-containing protein